MTTINVNYMTQTMGNIKQSNQVKNDAATKTSFTSSTGAVSVKDMTMEEYKTYISEKISQIPLHPSRMKESISLTISDAGFQAMKDDPEYEEWVLNDLRTGWAQPNAWVEACGGAYGTIHYGATKEEYRGSMWFPGYQNGNGEKIFDEKSKNSFWERKLERKKLLQEQYEKQKEKQRLQEEIYEKARFEKSIVAENLQLKGGILPTEI